MISHLPPWAILPTAVVICLVGPRASAADGFEQHEAHEHGTVTINVALEATRLTVVLDSPAVNVVGFEHAPRTADERESVRNADAYLKATRGLIGVPANARCRVAGVKLTTPQWGAEPAGEREGREQHADYEAEFSFQCDEPSNLVWFEPWLLDELHDVTEARINTITAVGQRSQVATRGRDRIPLL